MLLLYIVRYIIIILVDISAMRFGRVWRFSSWRTNAVLRLIRTKLHSTGTHNIYSIILYYIYLLDDYLENIVRESSSAAAQSPAYSYIHDDYTCISEW